jgi:outer membrane protein TolC
LKQAVARAPLVEARRAQARAAREQSARAGALPDPQVTAGIDNLVVQGPGAFTAGGDPMTMRIVGISQTLPSLSKRRAARAIGAANAELAASAQSTTAVEIRQQVAEVWITAWGAQEEKAMLRALKGAWAQDIAAAEGRQRGGTGSAADVLAARMEALDLANHIDAVTAQETEARTRLERWLGVPVEQPLGKAPDFGAPGVDKDALLAQLDRQGPLLGWPALEQVAEAALDEAHADKLPQWAIGMTYGFRANGLSDMVSVQVSVSLPIFPRDRQDRGIAARTADLAAVRAQHEDARRQQAERVQLAWAEWQALGEQVRRHRELVLLASDRSALALAAYRGGGDIQPLLQARRDELTHHAEYARMQAQYGRAWAALAYLLPESEMP